MFKAYHQFVGNHIFTHSYPPKVGAIAIYILSCFSSLMSDTYISVWPMYLIKIICLAITT